MIKGKYKSLKKCQIFCIVRLHYSYIKINTLRRTIVYKIEHYYAQ